MAAPSVIRVSSISRPTGAQDLIGDAEDRLCRSLRNRVALPVPMLNVPA